MKTYRMTSTPAIYTPGVFHWIMMSVLPFDLPKAEELLAALGFPDEVAASLAQRDPAVTWTVEDETLIVTTP